jgi:hypothetical protein
MKLRLLAFSIIAVLAASGAVAQTSVRRALPGGYSAELQSGEILVQAQRSLSLAVDRSEDAQAKQDEAIRMIYRMADRECALLLETIAETCELVGVNANASFNDQNRSPTVNASGNFSMKVRLKQSAGSAK